MRFDTRLIHSGQPADPLTGAVNVPVYLSSTFRQSAPNRHRGYVYSRSGNPTRRVLESALAAAESGRTGLAFSSGLGALTTLLEAFPTGSRIVSVDDLYGGTWRLFEHHRRQFGVRFDYVDMTDPARVADALDGDPTAMVYVESPTNPLLRIVDLRAVVRLAHRAGAVVAVDNTFASPLAPSRTKTARSSWRRRNSSPTGASGATSGSGGLRAKATERSRTVASSRPRRRTSSS